MKSSSAKAKGRRLQDRVVRMLYDRFRSFQPGDVKPAIMGESGVDVHLSPAARAAFPFAIETKNTERLNVWEAIKQAEANAAKVGMNPLVVFSRNRSGTYAVIEFDTLLTLLSEGRQ